MADDDDLFEQSAQKSEALVKVLKQVCSRNKAIEKQEMWKQRDREDRSSRKHGSVKRHDGTVMSDVKVPKGANVTKNSVNQYEEERLRNSNKKEDQQLDKFCDGKNHSWRPDFFFTETAEGTEDIPPWPVRPNEIFTNPELCARIMARRMERKQKRAKEKKDKKAAKKADKKSSKKDKKKSKKKDKKKNKKKKEKKNDKKDKDSKGKKGRKDKKRKAASSSSSSSSPGSSDEDKEEEDEGKAGVPMGSPTTATGGASSPAEGSPSSDDDGAGRSSPSEEDGSEPEASGEGEADQDASSA